MNGESDPEGPAAGSSPLELDVERWPAVVGLLVAAGGALFLVEPLVGPIAVGSVEARPVALSAVVLAAGFCLGAPVFFRRGRRLFGIAHGIFGLAWAGVAAGTAVGSGTLVVGAVVLVVAGAGFLVSRARRW
ncbi:hypothetical protein [Halobellus clavatus]|uniref:Uncharacterized protein n=1 Tax=Halobellus clavatus TaxID=660517 RepID=A0A1H3KDU6_9EURY|nr:hypothetical protein [Halobellus clavatus]SDY50392.1 hypothetical protein SAMN04487946_1197 [Halobellus clavatus]